MRRLLHRIVAYAELGRVSNLPTCLTNVLAGAVLGAGSEALAWGTVSWIALAVAVLYVGGMALNDAVDLEIDRYVNPHRPLPSGRISQRAACVFAIVMILVGLGVLAAVEPRSFMWGAVLAGAILVYNLIHQATGWSVVVMGACRGLVYLVAAAGLGGDPCQRAVLGCAAIVTAYTVGLSLVARVEDRRRAGPRRWIAVVLPIIVLSAAFFVSGGHPVGVGVAAGVVIVWLGLAARQMLSPRASTREAVLGWLAGFCLIDMYILTLMDAPIVAGGALAGFLVTVIGHSRVSGT
jgi:4-hydroxybenzoate polyprenyltransferase